MPICIAIIAFVIIIGAASQKKVQAAPCLNSKAVPVTPGVPINQNVLVANKSNLRGAPQAQVEAAQNSQPAYSDFQANVEAGLGTDAVELSIEGLIA